ncbi:hypothetical protein [Nonomuraea sp. B1E8]|uniref:hypothetical protein n=1 Tax=unclassified Nonomuraea TaxID=2593643 RepID=UPI00325D67B2
MYRYKEPMPDRYRLRNPSYQRLLLLLIGFAEAHAHCLSALAPKPVTGMAVVPSLRGRVGTHPLATLGAVLPGHWEKIDLHAARDVPEAERRQLRPEHFTVPDPAAAAGQHIVVLEDTWVQGGHAQSAASALLLAGASEVTIVVIARRIRPDFGRPELKASLQRIVADREYSLECCPVTGDVCRVRLPRQPGKGVT